MYARNAPCLRIKVQTPALASGNWIGIHLAEVPNRAWKASIKQEIVQSGRLIWHAGGRHAAVTSKRIGKFLPNIK